MSTRKFVGNVRCVVETGAKWIFGRLSFFGVYGGFLPGEQQRIPFLGCHVFGVIMDQYFEKGMDRQMVFSGCLVGFFSPGSRGAQGAFSGRL